MHLVTGAAIDLAEHSSRAYRLDFIDGAGRRQQEPLAACWNLRFEDVRPVRTFRWSKRQRHWPGWWWFATTAEQVGYESWLERDHVLLLDFDPVVVGLSSQPFWLHWPGGERDRRHAPDYFARLTDGTGVVIDVRADDRIELADAASRARSSTGKLPSPASACATSSGSGRASIPRHSNSI
ncbi:TnsA-like heteromeric transposase endonuclease subunit [Kibdelosporangium aridum]|uniref:TnsA-like heteromeric transposase endonuclease subunit n=1 Tax=Kibdelosporangium aridum TaxID=2030 RepID=UPI001C8C0AC5|nr:TnsA-like heteromeric transposase endonuclease subunit [Kibdelosporangium aridum]